MIHIEFDDSSLLALEMMEARAEVIAATNGLFQLMSMADHIQTHGVTPTFEQLYGEELHQFGITMSTEGFFSKIKDGIVWLWTKLKNFIMKIVNWIKSLWGKQKDQQDTEKLQRVTVLIKEVTAKPNWSSSDTLVTPLSAFMELGRFLVKMRMEWDDLVQPHLTAIMFPKTNVPPAESFKLEADADISKAIAECDEKIKTLQARTGDVKFTASDWFRADVQERYQTITEALRAAIDTATEQTQLLIAKHAEAPLVKGLLEVNNVTAPTDGPSTAEQIKLKYYRYHLDAVVKILILRCDKTLKIAAVAKDIMSKDLTKVHNALERMNKE